MNRQHRDAAETAPRAPPARRRDRRRARSRSAYPPSAARGTRHRPTTAACLRAPHAPAAFRDRAKSFCRDGSWNGGFISTRSAVPGAMPCAAKSPAAPVTSRVTALTRSLIPLRAILSAASAESSGSISTSVTSTSGTRNASASPAAPTPAPNSTTRSPECACVAAASRIASWPTRWPRALLPQTQPSAEHRIVGEAG